MENIRRRTCVAHETLICVGLGRLEKHLEIVKLSDRRINKNYMICIDILYVHFSLHRGHKQAPAQNLG